MLIDSEMNEIGACVQCKNPLESVSSYQIESQIPKSGPAYVILSKCVSCFSFYADIYDLNWSWIEESDPMLLEKTILEESSESMNLELNKVMPEIEISKNKETNEDQDLSSKNNLPLPPQKRTGQKTKNRKYNIPVYSDIVESADDLKKIPLIQLKSVFSESEIEAMMEKAKGEKPVRQYFHRAKKKYKIFEDIFGIKININ
ncbi:hypothetical protein [Methanolapillus millepedarum]